jgi:hypothetical protein
MPDGRSRRKQLAKKGLEPPKYVRIADQAKGLLDDNMLMIDICKEVGCDRTTLTRAIAHWHQSRGLPAPDGRSRRKTLEQKSRPPGSAKETGPRAEPSLSA